MIEQKLFQCEFCGCFSDSIVGEVMIVKRKENTAICTACLDEINETMARWGGNHRNILNRDYKVVI